MALIFWDASALAKRYTLETGSPTIDAIFQAAITHSMASTPWGYAETYSILRRRRNQGAISPTSFTSAISALQREVINDPNFELFTLSDAIIFGSIAAIHKHNLNATDAAILTLLDLTQIPGAPACLLVTSDKRLERAASAENLAVLNPEQTSPDSVSTILTNQLLC